MLDQFQIKNDDAIPNSKYKLFAQIGFAAKHIGQMTYFPIIKKRVKGTQSKWYSFQEN